MPSRGAYEGPPGVVEPGGCVDTAVCQHDWRRDSDLSVYPTNSFTCTKCGADRLRLTEADRDAYKSGAVSMKAAAEQAWRERDEALKTLRQIAHIASKLGDPRRPQRRLPKGVRR